MLGLTNMCETRYCSKPVCHRDKQGGGCQEWNQVQAQSSGGKCLLYPLQYLVIKKTEGLIIYFLSRVKCLHTKKTVLSHPWCGQEWVFVSTVNVR